MSDTTPDDRGPASYEEPWSVFEPDDPQAWPGIETARRALVVYGYPEDDDCGVKGPSPAAAREMARRIVAAVNAVRGVSTADLEADVVAEMRAVIGRLMAECREHDDSYYHVTDPGVLAEASRVLAKLGGGAKGA